MTDDSTENWLRSMTAQHEREMVLEAFYAALDAGDTSAYAQRFHPDVAWSLGSETSGRGLAQLMEVGNQSMQALRRVRHSCTAFHHAPATNHTTVELSVDYHRRDDKVVTLPAAIVLHADDRELIDEYRIYVDVSKVWG